MKKVLSIIALFTMMLTGCSLLDEVNNSLDYVNDAKSYINSLTDFAEGTPQLIQDAAGDPEAMKELESQLNGLVEQVNEFNDIDAPAIADSIHQEIITKNEVLLEEIDKAMENGELAIEKLENSQLMDTINEVTSLLDTIEKLGQ